MPCILLDRKAASFEIHIVCGLAGFSPFIDEFVLQTGKVFSKYYVHFFVTEKHIQGRRPQAMGWGHLYQLSMCFQRHYFSSCTFVG